MRGVPVVVIANKQDLPNVLKCNEIVNRLSLDRLSQTKNKWFIQGACAINGDGLYEAMKEMADLVKEKQKN